MKTKNKKSIAEVQAELDEAREILRAIQSGEIDALVINDNSGEKIFTLKSADQPYRILVENMNEGAATLNQSGLIFYCNMRFSELLQKPLEKVIGAEMQSFLFDEDIPTFEKTLKKGLSGESTIALSLKNSTVQSTPVQISMSAVEVDGGSGVCLIATDLTERKKAEDQLRNSHNELEERVKRRTDELAKAVRVRDEFLSIASHELKTPLTSLKLQAQLRKRRISLGDEDFFSGERIAKMVNDDERQINRLIRLVDDMLDTSRIATGKLSLNTEKMDLGQLVSDVLDRYRSQVVAFNTRINLSIDEPVVGHWDRYRLEQIFTNLLTNAIKYGKGNPINVRVSSFKQIALLIVEDGGIGIAKADQSRVFEQFERAVSVNEVSGMGLGLYIVKQLVEAHRGKIHLQSRLGKAQLLLLKFPFTLKGLRIRTCLAFF